ncbi:MAG TPA: hypothetical protein VHY22_11040 [Chthoniobacteraceae bacterium]|jgi:hypothetical protein|nr:hypothetical protein [Chthoniobacteraceae bacterium]
MKDMKGPNQDTTGNWRKLWPFWIKGLVFVICEKRHLSDHGIDRGSALPGFWHHLFLPKTRLSTEEREAIPRDRPPRHGNFDDISPLSDSGLLN